ncbi:MAG: DUF72 domain-containing protein [Candidatus Eisenbacteria bacterium]
MIWIGTSGYSFKDWVGPFYPPGTKAADMLEYQRQFPAVEVNASYYRLPTADTFRRMAARTPPDFRFTVKFHRALTHDLDRDPEAMRAFLRAIEPLEASGRFHGALAQFPWAFRDTPANRDYLRMLRDRYRVLPLFVEFRHASWAHPGAFDFLRAIEAGFCAVDEPRLTGLFPPLVEATTPVAYVRFHGRNEASWWGGDNAERYNYLYSEEELREWAEKIRALETKSREVLVFFNNCHSGRAAQNAKRMAELLDLPGI